jgi:hypothetical protein
MTSDPAPTGLVVGQLEAPAPTGLAVGHSTAPAPTGLAVGQSFEQPQPVILNGDHSSLPVPDKATSTLVATITSQVVSQQCAGGILQIPREQDQQTSSNQTPVPHNNSRYQGVYCESPVSSDGEDEFSTPGVIAGAINGLLSGENDIPNAKQENDFQSVGLPLGVTVHAKIKCKIWADEYIELRSLAKDADDEEITFTVSKHQGQSALSVTPPSQRVKPVDNIQDWTNAMMTLGAIYTERHPKTAPQMFKYIRNIRDMHARGGNWQYYDTQFRKLKGKRNWNWDFIQWELHFTAMGTPLQHQTSGFSGSLSNNSRLSKKPKPFLVLHGFCWGFHHTGKCGQSKPCPYKHLCFRCQGGQHAAKWCSARRDDTKDARSFTISQKCLPQ